MLPPLKLDAAVHEYVRNTFGQYQVSAQLSPTSYQHEHVMIISDIMYWGSCLNYFPVVLQNVRNVGHSNFRYVSFSKKSYHLT